MSRWDSRVAAVVELLGPEALVFEERAGWVIGICANRKAGPPYALEIYGEGETFDTAWAQAARLAVRRRPPVHP